MVPVSKRAVALTRKKTCKQVIYHCWIWEIGWKMGLYYAGWLCHLHLFIGKIFGVAARRGRAHKTEYLWDIRRISGGYMPIKRKLKWFYIPKMKLRGEAWQGFKIMNSTAYQTTAFRPRRLMLK